MFPNRCASKRVEQQRTASHVALRSLGRSYLEGLHPHWRAVPLDDTDTLKRALARSAGAAGTPADAAAVLSNAPQLLLLDSNGRMLVEDGIRYESNAL